MFDTTDPRQNAMRTGVLAAVVLGGLSVAVGLAIAMKPTSAWILTASIVGLALLEVPAGFWAIGAILAACLARVGTKFGLPSFLNFAHFPLAVGGLVVLLVKGANMTPLAKKLRLGLSILLVISFVSWAVNDGELLRPVLTYLVFMEPFLLLFILVAARPVAKVEKILRLMVLGLPLVQLPIGIWQYIAVAHGNPDLVQGTFIGQGAGAHIAGGVALLGVFACISRAAMTTSGKVRLQQGLLAAAIFILPVIADAKQAIVCFVPGLALLILLSGTVKISKLIMPACFGSLLLYVAYLLYPPLQMVTDTNLITKGLQGKIIGLNGVLQGISEAPGAGLVGVGPGNSVSRVALLTGGAQVKDDSPVARLGLKTAPLTRELLHDDDTNYLSTTSSVWTVIASWSGLLGDLGYLGLATYLWMCCVIWRALARQGTWLGTAARAGMVMAALLGMIFSWLEEPGFTLALTSLMALALVQVKRPSPPPRNEWVQDSVRMSRAAAMQL